jgi:predicted Zn-ribbon and HTH transcriptional regulator
MRRTGDGRRAWNDTKTWRKTMRAGESAWDEMLLRVPVMQCRKCGYVWRYSQPYWHEPICMPELCPACKTTNIELRTPCGEVIRQTGISR